MSQVEELRKGGGHERGHSKRDDVANKGDRRRSHTTRRRGHAMSCTDEVRGHQQKRRSETTAVREALRHRPGQYEVLVPRQRACSICTCIACRKKQPAGPTAKQSNSKLDGCKQLSWILSSKKTRPGSRRRARRVVRGEKGTKGGAKSGVFHFRPKNPKKRTQKFWS